MAAEVGGLLMVCGALELFAVVADVALALEPLPLVPDVALALEPLPPVAGVALELDGAAGALVLAELHATTISDSATTAIGQSAARECLDIGS